jgi:hypothetical protein
MLRGFEGARVDAVEVRFGPVGELPFAQIEALLALALTEL